MLFSKIPLVLKKIYPRRIWDGPPEGKTIYLTFDDGPIPQITPWVLDQLNKYGAQATFFCIGDNIRKYPETLDLVSDENHVLGSHTFNHLNGWKTPADQYIRNVQQGHQILTEHSSGAPNLGAVDPRLFRPPYGRITSRQAKVLEKQGYRIVMWDVLSGDYNSSRSPDTCFRSVTQNSESGSIVVFHDSLKAAATLKKILPATLAYFSDRGFNFRGLP